VVTCKTPSEQRAAAAFGTASALDELQRLREQVAAPHALRDSVLRETGIPTAVGAILTAMPSDNPTPVTAANLEELLLASMASMGRKEAR
jgi:maleylacetate reductase